KVSWKPLFLRLMAFLLKEIKKSGTYLSICESCRDEAGRVQRKVLRHLGNAKDYNEESLERIGRQLIEIAKGPTPEPENIQELSRYNYGFPLVIYQLLRLYDLDVLMKRLTRKHKLTFSLLQHLLLMLCDRFNDPLSKLGSYNLQNEYTGLGQSVELHHIYRTLDYLAANNDIIQTHIYNKNRNLFNYELDVVFYDVTTFYFDSEVQEDGALRQMGFGKDGKIGKTQILFSLLIDKNKVPIGFQIFKGDQYEGHTFEKAIEKLKAKYNIKRIIVVADSGMLNKANIALFDKGGTAEGFEYIVGDRLKSMGEAAIEHLTNLNNYTTVIIKDSEGKDVPLKYCSYPYNGRTIICTWSEKRAKKDKAEREEKIAKAQKMLNQPSNIEKKASRYFIKNTGEKKYTIDQQKIDKQVRFDGFKAIATNAKDITPQLALEKYKDLYKIEQSFRSFKSYFETRPMFHWTDTRIEGHIVLCYISFCLLAFLQNKCSYSEQTIRKLISRMELSKIVQDGEVLWLRSATNEQAEHLLKTIHLKQLPTAISDATIKKHLPYNL
ncbi:MAG TPA: IS1634 family transposase, partial [Segetibacter sp.]